MVARWTVAGLLLLVFLAGCGAGPAARRRGAEDSALLPGTVPVPGWRAEGPSESVAADGLYDRIDGGAELFLGAGFQRLVVRDYTDGSEEIEAQLFVLGSAAKARHVWERQGRAAGKVAGLPGPASVDRYQLVALLGRCYLVVDNLSGGESAQAAMEALARDVATETAELCGG